LTGGLASIACTPNRGRKIGAHYVRSKDHSEGEREVLCGPREACQKQARRAVILPRSKGGLAKPQSRHDPNPPKMARKMANRLERTYPRT
jgi:hypothetical protein